MFVRKNTSEDSNSSSTIVAPKGSPSGGHEYGPPAVGLKIGGQSPEKFIDASLKSVLRGAQDWKERRAAIAKLTSQVVNRELEVLFEIAKGNDVDAVRIAAVTRISDWAKAESSGNEVVSRFTQQLYSEARLVLRQTLLTSLAELYQAQPSANGGVIHTFNDIAKNHEDASTRGHAIAVLSERLPTESSRTLLSQVSQSEQSPEVLQRIAFAISSVESRAQQGK